MSRHGPGGTLPPAQLVAERVFSALERFLHIEAVSGIALLVAAAAALIWANSPVRESYYALWHAPLTVGIAEVTFSRPLHFWINDGLMTVFFLVVGMEVRREMYEGALANLQLASLPLAAALGGVALPALVYLAINTDPALQQGWAVPTATDIAFAAGVLALLGKSIPGAIRILLLAIAIIDDIVAVIIIAVFYSGGLNYSGLLVAGFGIVLVLGLQRIGVGSAYAYVVPGAIVWFGLLWTGAHPTLAGVVLGLMTPVLPARTRERPLDTATRALGEVQSHAGTVHTDSLALSRSLKQLRSAQREMLPPVVRVQMALHPWVAYVIVPLFALANAGVSIESAGVASHDSIRTMLGVFVALVFGKPIGILLGSWVAVRAGWCLLPPTLTWRGVALVGCLGGIGFTMAIFIATLAFGEGSSLIAAKSGVLLASGVAGIIGWIIGRTYTTRARSAATESTNTRSRDAPSDRQQ